MMGRSILLFLVLAAALSIGVMTPECASAEHAAARQALLAGVEGPPSPSQHRPCHESFLTLGGHTFDSSMQLWMIQSVWAALVLPPLALLATPTGECCFAPRPAAIAPITPPPRSL